MTIRFFFVTVILSVMFVLSLLAQHREWEDITDEELLMEGIPQDPEADAVILFNTCRIQITPEFDLEIYYHKRIKILTEVGKEYANIEISFWHEDKIYDLEAKCYTPDGKEHELDEDNIFEERNKNWKKKKFAIPGVEIGSVIEYRYRLFSDYISQLEPWLFQENNYTKYSEITVLLPSGFNYTALPLNILDIDIEKTNEEVRNPYDYSKECVKYTWIVKDKPGIKKEPYMKAFHDYYAQVLFQLVSYKSPYFQRSYTKTWDELAIDMWQNFENRINQNGDIEDFTENYIKGITDPEKKVKKIYDYIRTEIRTTGSDYLGGDRFNDPEKVFETKEGSTSEKNVLLINMLKKANIDADLLLISTRNHGGVATNWVALQQFNRIISRVKIGEQTLFLNCGHKYCPMGYLSPEYDVGIGLLVTENKGQIVQLKPLNPRNRLEIDTRANLMEDGQLTLHSVIEYKGMCGITERDRIEDKDLDEFIKEILEEIRTEAVLDSFKYTNVDSVHLPLVLDLTYHIPNFYEDTGSLIFFTLPLFTGQSKNVFVHEKRNFPVDFEFEQTQSEKLEIALADCYQIDELPKKSSARMRSFKFNKIYFSSDNKVECNRTYKLSSKQFSEFDYPKLRKMYEKMVNSDQDQVVLTKLR